MNSQQAAPLPPHDSVRPIEKGQPLTPEQQTLETWASNVHIRNLENVQQALIRVATIGASFAAGSVAFLRDSMSHAMQLWTVGLLLVSLALSVAGSIPYPNPANHNDFASIRAMLISATENKRNYLSASLIFLAGALLAGMYGMLTFHPSVNTPLAAPVTLTQPVSTAIHKSATSQP
jgi:hypothetical protein